MFNPTNTDEGGVECTIMASELFAPNNLLEQCLGLQEIIAAASPDEKRQAGDDARQMIIESQLNYHGATKLEVHTLGAFGLPDGLTLESQVYPVVSYPAMRIGGMLGNIAFVSLHRLNSLAWMMVDPIVRESTADTAMPPPEVNSDPDSIDTIPIIKHERLLRPLYVPVGMIESVFAAN